MLEVNVKEARAGFSKLLDKVEQGQHILLTRRGRKVARFIPPEQENRLPSLKAFRQEIARAGQGHRIFHICFEKPPAEVLNRRLLKRNLIKRKNIYALQIDLRSVR